MRFRVRHPALWQLEHKARRRMTTPAFRRNCGADFGFSRLTLQWKRDWYTRIRQPEADGRSGLYAKRRHSRWSGERWIVRMLCNHAGREVNGRRYSDRLQHSENDGRKRNACRRELAYYDTGRRHRLATILTLMVVPHALHRIAALHRLFGSGSWAAIEAVSRKSDGDQYDQHSSCKPHDNQGRGPALCESMARCS